MQKRNIFLPRASLSDVKNSQKGQEVSRSALYFGDKKRRKIIEKK
jgi:hypothetical protein